MRESLADFKSALLDAIAAVVAPNKEEVYHEIATVEQYLAAVVGTSNTQLHSIVTTTVETGVHTKFLVVEKIVRAVFGALDNRMTHSEFSSNALERKYRSSNTILFGVEESWRKTHECRLSPS
jgi:hypothetical protein